MLDIRWIRENKERVQTAADQKGIAVSIGRLLTHDERRRRLLQEAERLRHDRNELSRKIGELVKRETYDQTDVRANVSKRADGRADDQATSGNGAHMLTDQKEQLRESVKQINDRLDALELELAEEEEAVSRLMMLVPNVVSPDTPVGRSDADNVAIRYAGEPTAFAFEPRDHVALGELHDMIDIVRGVKTAGTRNYYLKGAGVLLHRAVQQLAIDLLTAEGFTLLEVPLMVRTDALLNTGYFPLGQDQTYRIAEEDKWLAGTSEVPLVNYYADEIVDLHQPVKLAAASTCFRSEVGSAGKDVHGLYRVHQFAKVEQVVLCEADPALSEQLLQAITGNAERLLQLLELPYRVMAVCSGDMSQKTYKQYDIETWMPSRAAYGETHSSSNLHDFQARRSNIRYRDAHGKLRFCHTLNNTAVASPRILIPLLENHQNEDGSIRIPKALQPYMNGMERLIPG